MNAARAIVFISSQAPWSSGAPLACLDALMTTAVFDVPVRFVLLGAGVLQLVSKQDGSTLGSRNLSKMFGALGLYGIDTIHVDAAALNHYDLSLADLLQTDDGEAPLHLAIVDAAAIAQLLSHSKAVFNF